MTPIQIAALEFIFDRRIDRATGRCNDLYLTTVSEPMRQRIIDLGMMEPPLIDMDGPRVVMTLAGIREIAKLRGTEQRTKDCGK